MLVRHRRTARTAWGWSGKRSGARGRVANRPDILAVLPLLPENCAREVLETDGIVTLVNSDKPIQLGRHVHSLLAQHGPEGDSWNAAIGEVAKSLPTLV